MSRMRNRGQPLIKNNRWLSPIVWLVMACSIAWVALFWPTLGWMAERFDAHDSFYSHGWLVPVAAAWLIWQRRLTLGRLVWQPSAAGLALLVPAVLLNAAAAWLQLHVVSGLAMLAAVWGLVWTFAGWPITWRLRMPLLFLLFMVPLPGVLLIAASFYMKLFAAALATPLVNLLGVPAIQAGSTIHLAHTSVIVDDTCSGLRSLISLLALATLWTALLPTRTPRWQKLLIVAAAAPIALLANMVRILLLIMIAAIYGPQAADGFIHYGAGITVFGVALALLFAFSHQLRAWSATATASSRS